MSFVITSNINLLDSPDTAEIFKPYSYTNRLTNTMTIDKDSEVSVQSVKLNKNGLYSVNRQNSRFGCYFGRDITPAETIEETPNHPFAGSIINTNHFAELTPEELSTKILEALGRTINDPSQISSITGTNETNSPIMTAGSNVELKLGANNEFEGYTYTFLQDPDCVDEVPGADSDRSEFPTEYYTYDGADTLTCDDVLSTTGCCVMFKDFPVSANSQGDADPSLEVNFEDANGNDLSRWCIGLSRYDEPQYHPDGSFRVNSPPYYDNRPSRGAGSNVAWPYTRQCYDFVVCRVGDYLRVFQSVINSDRNPRALGTNKNHLVMKEVIYYGDHSDHFDAGPYNIKDNDDDYNCIQFQVHGEKIIAKIGENGAGWEDLVHYNNQVGNPNFDRYCAFSPRSCLQSVLYPKLYIKRNTEELVINHRFTYDNITEWHFQNPHASWVNRLIKDDLYNTWGWPVERRSWNNYSQANADVIYVPKGLNASHGREDYQCQLLCSPSIDYGIEYTEDFGAENILGFRGVPIAKPIGANLTELSSILESIRVPLLINNKSLFVRLNNFTHNSANSKLGNAYSKLLCHLPRFDTIGNEFGGVYYEPHERVYVALNNPEDLFINSFDIDIVYDNEEFAECLKGKTIVCLHFRPRGIRLLDNEYQKEVRNKVEQIVISN